MIAADGGARIDRLDSHLDRRARRDLAGIRESRSRPSAAEVPTGAGTVTSSGMPGRTELDVRKLSRFDRCVQAPTSYGDPDDQHASDRMSTLRHMIESRFRS